MKKFILLISFFLVFVSGFSQFADIKRRIDMVQPESVLPMESNDYRKGMESCGVAPQNEKLLKLPMYVYRDLQCTQKRNEEAPMSNFTRKFQSKNGNYRFVKINMGNGDANRGILYTLTPDAKPIDYIEVEAGWLFPDLFVKQFLMDSTYELCVYRLHPMSDKPIDPYAFEKFEGYRTDTYYRVDDEGKFHSVREVTYKPQWYFAKDIRLERPGYYYIRNGREEVDRVTDVSTEKK